MASKGFKGFLALYLGPKFQLNSETATRVMSASLGEGERREDNVCL